MYRTRSGADSSSSVLCAMIIGDRNRLWQIIFQREVSPMVEHFSLFEFVPTIERINIVDIGAMEVDSDQAPYTSLLKADRARVIGFEPNAEECDKLMKKHGEPYKFYPYFVGDGADATFYETNWTPTGSLFRPNHLLLERFQNLNEFTLVKATHTVQTVKLDDIQDLGDIDLIKIDVQGSELNVFKGAKNALACATAIHTEVEFVEMYVDQPLFADIDAFLRGVGYQFHTLLGVVKRCFKPMIVNGDKNLGIRQFIWADALYVKDFMRFDQIPIEKLKKLAVLLHDLYRSYDLCLAALREIDHRSGSLLGNEYLSRLT